MLNQNESKTLEKKQKWNAYIKLYKKKRSEKHPGFECEYQIQISGTVENLTTGCQSEVCVLPVLCNAHQITSVSHGDHTSSSVLTITWKDSVKTTLG